jgi:hypothetical protein
VVCDRDLPGYRHAREVARSLSAVVDSVLIGEARYGKDVADHLAAGLPLDDLALLTAEELDQLCADVPADTEPEVTGPELTGPTRLKSGATFVLDDRADLDPIWGSDDEVLWASVAGRIR